MPRKTKQDQPSITPAQKAAAREQARKAKTGDVPEGMVATKRPAGDIVVGDRIGRKMSGPFDTVKSVKPSQSGTTVQLFFEGDGGWTPKSKTDVWVLVPAADKPADEKPAPTGIGAQLAALDGQNVEVQISGSMSLGGGGMKMPTFHKGVLSAHDTKGGEQRWKVGRRVVSQSTIASVKAVEAPAPTPAPDKPTPAEKPEPTPAKPKSTEIADDAKAAVDVLPAYIVNYVEQHGSTDPMAPMVGDPFVQAGRLYLQLEGRGGAGKKDDVAATTGLRPFLRDTNGGLGDKPKKVLQLALTALGFERNPFPYVHPDRGSTASSYYSVPLDTFPLDVHAEPRQTKRDRKSIERATSVANTALLDVPVPQRPDGSPEDVAELDRLWKAYDGARDAWKAACIKRKSQDVQDAAMTATRDANAALLAHRKAMVAKLAEAKTEAAATA